MPFCTMCDVPVFSRSKHCRACSKCVDVFDHHCMWLNNCVGGQNYRAFFVTVSAVAAMIGIIEACCCSRGGPVTLRDRVCIAKDSDKLAAILRQRLDAAAKVAISTRGHFALAIPGGSVLDLLKGWTPEWSSKAVVAYVNHKCVPSDDPKNSTHAKAVRSFLSGWPGVTIVEPAPSNLLVDSAAEAYADKLAAVPEAMLPCAGGLPCFDVMLLGMGDDGHIGSLHPYREEILTSGPWVLPVAKGSPASITMSLPVMTAAPGRHRRSLWGV